MPEADPLSPERLLAHVDMDVALAAGASATLPSNDAVLASALHGGADASSSSSEAAGAIGDAAARLRHPRARRADTPRPPNARCAASARYAGALTSIEELERAAAGWGLISVADRSGIDPAHSARRERQGTLVPAFALEMLRVASRAPASGS